MPFSSGLPMKLLRRAARLGRSKAARAPRRALGRSAVVEHVVGFVACVHRDRGPVRVSLLRRVGGGGGRSGPQDSLPVSSACSMRRGADHRGGLKAPDRLRRRSRMKKGTPSMPWRRSPAAMRCTLSASAPRSSHHRAPVRGGRRRRRRDRPGCRRGRRCRAPPGSARRTAHGRASGAHALRLVAVGLGADRAGGARRACSGAWRCARRRTAARRRRRPRAPVEHRLGLHRPPNLPSRKARWGSPAGGVSRLRKKGSQLMRGSMSGRVARSSASARSRRTAPRKHHGQTKSERGRCSGSWGGVVSMYGWGKRGCGQVVVRAGSG